MAAGVDALTAWDCTPGELIAAIEAFDRRRRTELQDLSVLAYTYARYFCQVFSGHHVGSVQETFPFWTQEDIQSSKVDQVMQRLKGMHIKKEAPG